MKAKHNYYIIENLFKNLLMLVVVAFFIPGIEKGISQVNRQDAESILGLIGLLLVFSAAVNFTFSYEAVNFTNIFERYLAHMTTYIAQIVMILLICALIFLVKSLFPFLFIFALTIGSLSIITILLFDFWDLLKNQKIQK
ncbi:hypothetical protein COY16_02105 [Candidatus Roizmanbacteria bacterium CG_4_10_14_0_2_um_filter_39_13]|uniref:Uncharacterized protein n=1 Tax=Candidatus Roizmanbacteria bacterium CG_4_10_14_0_2_um_filter_39_13 TaxID=1974825 RepID=A0A2M7U004_9BACT|nr:MAG: hypothetical protein COY16_02105 [Candidatus Roizmanbacteria bacterium CG_4_10_14_0_2_um_filter_39_13]